MRVKIFKDTWHLPTRTLDVRVMILRSGVQITMGSNSDKDEETGAVGAVSQEIDNYGIDRPEDRLKKQLGVLIEDRELIMVAMKDFIIELKDISTMDVIDEDIESRIMELKLIVEPMLIDIKSLSKDIQDVMKTLNFKSELVTEYTSSRSYDAKVGMLLDKCSKKKQIDSSQQTTGKPTTTNSFVSMNSPHGRSFGNEQPTASILLGGLKDHFPCTNPWGNPLIPICKIICHNLSGNPNVHPVQTQGKI